MGGTAQSQTLECLSEEIRRRMPEEVAEDVLEALSEDVAERLAEHGECSTKDLTKEVLRTLEVRQKGTKKEVETSIRADKISDKLKISSSQRGPIQSLLRHEHSEVVGAHIYLGDEGVCISSLSVELPVGCLIVQETPRKSHLLSVAFKA